MAVTNNILAEVRNLAPYTLKATVAPIKLNQNESPWDVSEEFKQKILERVREQPWNRYPDFHPADVLQGLGEMHGLVGENVLIGNGSNELIQAIFSATVAQGTRVAIPVPTFSLYKMMIAANQGECIEVPLNQDFTYSLAAWSELADAGEAHLLLCSPNNPTGSTVTRDFVADLATRTPKLVIIDEAYVHFGEEDLSDLVQAHDNIIVLRTFSKASGLASVRFGYALASKALVPELHKVKLPYNVGVFGLEVARAAIADPHVLDAAAQPLVRERTRLENALKSMPFDRVLHGMANFVVVSTPRAQDLFDALFAQGILIRNIGGYPMLENHLRISLGTPEENDALIAALHTYFA